MLKLHSILYEVSIRRLVITSFVFVLLLPIFFFVYSLFQSSWNEVEQDMLEKHHIISTSLIEPFSQYIDDKQHVLHMIGQELQQGPNHPFNTREQYVQAVMEKYLSLSRDLITMVYTNDHKIAIALDKTPHNERQWLHYNEATFRPLVNSDGQLSSSDALSPVFKSRVTGESVVLLRHKIQNTNNTINGTLSAEVSLRSIIAMCNNINFGVKGHCAVVDHQGQVIAHPNADWVHSIHDLSMLSIVQSMISGDSGTTSFYSPFIKTEMVAGFSAVPRLGWGIMIPQPKSELDNRFNDLRKNILLWLLFGVLSAALIAWILADEIITPIRLLMHRTHQVAQQQYIAELGPIPQKSPKEIKQLWDEFSSLLSGLQQSHREVDRLNQSLYQDIEKATHELREKNKKLYELSTLDYLTSLPNRRFFTTYLNQQLQSDAHHQIGVIFIDIDHFKTINDTFGHEIGDAVLIHLGTLLMGAIRQNDIAARLGGDEFVIYIADANKIAMRTVSEKIRQAAQDTPLVIKHHTITLSLSLGTICHLCDNQITAKEFFNLADKAMYESKRKGRNAITHCQTNKT